MGFRLDNFLSRLPFNYRTVSFYPGGSLIRWVQETLPGRTVLLYYIPNQKKQYVKRSKEHLTFVICADHPPARRSSQTQADEDAIKNRPAQSEYQRGR
jgi:hypothetical protein